MLAQACVSTLLSLGDRDEQDDHDEQGNDDKRGDHEEEDDIKKKAPLAVYAAEYWVRHAQFKDVTSRIKGMEHLFDVDKPYFALWRQVHDIDLIPARESVFLNFRHDSMIQRGARIPLYYAALCGFANLVEQLIAKYPEQVNFICGWYMTPAVAALAGRYFQVAELLHRNKSSVESRGFIGNTPLHSAAYFGDIEMVQVLLDYGADVNTQNDLFDTPLNFALLDDHQIEPKVARLLVEHGADPNRRGYKGFTALHLASKSGQLEIVRLLIEHGASVEVKNDEDRTPLDDASGEQREKIIKLLLEHK